MTDHPLVCALASPLFSMDREFGDSGEWGDARPVQEIESNSTFSMALLSSMIVEQSMATRKRDDQAVFPNAAGIDVGACLHNVHAHCRPGLQRRTLLKRRQPALRTRTPLRRAFLTAKEDDPFVA